MREIVPGHHYWTAAHPAWDPVHEPESPADWPEHVGCVLFERPGTATRWSAAGARRWLGRLPRRTAH